MNGIPIIDILLFAGVAIFLILRLGSVLGKRTGHENKPEDYQASFKQKRKKKDKILETPENEQENVVPLPSLKERHNREFDEEQLQGPLQQGYKQIREYDTEFSPSQFLEGATSAFEWILQAYVEGNKETLKELLASDVYNNFAASISQRESLGHRLEEMLVGIDSTEVLEAFMEGTKAHVTVKFKSKQVNVIYNNLGEIFSGDPNKVIDMVDIWIFARDTKSQNPNWTLIATRSPD